MQITFFVSSKTKAKLPLQPTRWDIIVPNVTTRIAETVRQRSKGLPVNSARAILGGSRPIFFTCASPMYFPLFPRPRRRPGVHLGDTDSRTRASENSGLHREEQEASTVEKRRDKRRGASVSRRKGWKQGVGWRGCIKASAQSEMFAGQKPTRPKICFGKWRARELVESRKKKLNPLAKTRQMESMDGRQRHLVTRAH